MNGMHSGGIVTETKNPTSIFQIHRLISYLHFALETNIPHFACDLNTWHFHCSSRTLHPNGSVASFTLNKSEVKEENKGIFQQMAQIPQLYNCWSKRLTFLHHKIGIKLYANGTSAHIKHSIFSDIKWIVSLFVCFSLRCTALTVNIWCVLQIIICLINTVTKN